MIGNSTHVTPSLTLSVNIIGKNGDNPPNLLNFNGDPQAGCIQSTTFKLEPDATTQASQGFLSPTSHAERPRITATRFCCNNSVLVWKRSLFLCEEQDLEDTTPPPSTGWLSSHGRKTERNRIILGIHQTSCTSVSKDTPFMFHTEHT